jgi:hypothetical protein
MNTTITRASAQSLPSVRQLKDEAKAKREESAAGSKKMGQNVALKELARKYGYKSWEALEAAARSSGVAAPSQSVVLYTIDGFDQHLIVNRKLVASSQVAMGDASLEDTAQRMADALGVALDRDGHMHDDEDTVDGEDRDTTKVLIDFGLIDPVTYSTNSTAGDSISSDGPFENFQQVVEKARNVPGFFNDQAPNIVFMKTAASQPNPDQTKGSIDCVCLVFVEVSADQAPDLRYTFYSYTDAEGRIEDCPASFSDKAYDCASDIVKDLIGAGIHLDSGKLMRLTSSDFWHGPL